MQNKKSMAKSKSAWAGLLLIVFAVSGMAAQQLSVEKGIEMFLLGISVLGLRHAIQKL